MAKLTDRTELTTPADGDLYVTTDVSDVTDAATGTDKKITWANIKAGLKTYFDTLYAAALGADDNYVTDAEKVVIGNTSGTNTGDNATNSQYSGLAASKQDTLVSGTNIKTINSTSLLGSGDIVISVADGDKGDVTVSSSGTVWTIDNDAVTFTKIQNVATNRVLARSTAGTGSVEDLTLPQFRTLINVEDGADVTDNANVTAAGALMDSELADITAIKTLLAPDNTTISTAAATVLDDATVGDMVNTLGGATSTGSGGIVRATSPTLVTPALGTPTAVVLTNATGTAAGLTAGTVTTNANLTGVVTSTGNATAIADSALSIAKTSGLQAALDTKASLTGTETLTNKRVTKRTGTTTSSATPSINTDNVDYYSITAQTAAITSMSTNLTGTPTTGQQLRIDITGTAARAITWGASFANGPVALPTTTVTTTRLYTLFEYDGTVWRCMASGSTV